jgi:predicted RNA binding protein YcfA (HicA-like mRNA interferase family)
MPSARAADFRRVASQLGFNKSRQTGSHEPFILPTYFAFNSPCRAKILFTASERWIHPDGRAVTIPIHGGREIGPPLYNKILDQLGISSEEFQRLK